MTLPWLLVYIFTWVPPQYPSFLVIYASASGCQMKISDWNGSERSVSTQVWHLHRSPRPAGGDKYTRLRPETVNINAAHNGQMSAGLSEFFFFFFLSSVKGVLVRSCHSTFQPAIQYRARTFTTTCTASRHFFWLISVLTRSTKLKFISIRAMDSVVDTVPLLASQLVISADEPKLQN